MGGASPRAKHGRGGDAGTFGGVDDHLLHFSASRQRNTNADSRRKRLTPVTNPPRLLFTSVEHGRDDHESGSDSAFASAQDEAHDKERAKGFASRVSHERYSPDKDVDAEWGEGGRSEI